MNVHSDPGRRRCGRVLKVPGPPWVEAGTVGYVAARVPLLSTQVLADTAAEVVDSRTVTFLLELALKEKKEEERQKEEEDDKKVKVSLERARLMAGAGHEDEEEAASSHFLSRWSSAPASTRCAPWNVDNLLRAPVSGCSEVSLLPEEHTRFGFFRGSTSGLFPYSGLLASQ